MSTLWTPDGEYHVKNDTPPQSEPTQTDAPLGDSDEEFLDSDQEAAEIAENIRAADPVVIVANHCYGFFQLAAIHLSHQPPNLASASLAIDALGAVLDSLGTRLGEYFEQFSDALAQLRLTFVQLSSLPRAENQETTPAE